MGIRMQYTLSGRLCNKSLKEFSDMKDSSFTPGGFAMDVPIHGKTVYVPFDWCSYSASVNEDGTMTVIHGEKTIFSVSAENELDEATEIREFYIDYWPAPANADSDDTLTVTKLCFLDDDGTEYPVDDAVLKAAGNVLKL